MSIDGNPKALKSTQLHGKIYFSTLDSTLEGDDFIPEPGLDWSQVSKCPSNMSFTDFDPAN